MYYRQTDNYTRQYMLGGTSGSSANTETYGKYACEISMTKALLEERSNNRKKECPPMDKGDSMTKEQKHEFALELVRKGQIGAKTYNSIYEYLFGDTVARATEE